MRLQEQLNNWCNENDTLISIHTPTQRERDICHRFLVDNHFYWNSGHPIEERLQNIWNDEKTISIQPAFVTFSHFLPSREEHSWFHKFSYKHYRIFTVEEFLEFCAGVLNQV